MNPQTITTAIRAVLTILAAAAAPALHAAGYTGGTATTIGVDGGTVRDFCALAFGGAAVFYPQLVTIWKSLSNEPRLIALENRVAALEKPTAPAEPADTVGPEKEKAVK